MKPKLIDSLTRPGTYSSGGVLTACAFIMLDIFLFDMCTDANNRLYVLYVVPLAAIALHCDNFLDIALGVCLALGFQLCTYFSEGADLPPLIKDASIFILLSMAVSLLARNAHNKGKNRHVAQHG